MLVIREQIRNAVKDGLKNAPAVMGRPDEYLPAYAEQAIQYIIDEPDISIAEVALRLGVWRDKLYKWAAKYEDMAYALHMIRTSSEAMRQRRLAIPGTDANAIYGSKAFDGYTDQPKELKVTGELKVVIETRTLTDNKKDTIEAEFEVVSD